MLANWYGVQPCLLTTCSAGSPRMHSCVQVMWPQPSLALRWTGQLPSLSGHFRLLLWNNHNYVVVVDRFFIQHYSPLSSRLIALACDPTWVTSFLLHAFEYPQSWVVYVLTVLTRLVPHETAAFSVRSVYTIQPCTVSLHAKPHISKVHACLAVTCHLHLWQNDQELWPATVVTQGWNRYQNKSMESWPWRIKLSHHSCRDSNLRRFNHESGTLTTELSHSPIVSVLPSSQQQQNYKKMNKNTISSALNNNNWKKMETWFLLLRNYANI